MRIIQIVSQQVQQIDPLGRVHVGTQVYGLGDDSNVYLYDFNKREWLHPEPLEAAKPKKPELLQ